MKSLSLIILALIVIGAIVFFTACKNSVTKSVKNENAEAAPIKFEKPHAPDWHKNATIYEVNLRQYTPEGTFKAFEAHVPRLKELGIDILWFMPIHEISEKNRKGT